MIELLKTMLTLNLMNIIPSLFRHTFTSKAQSRGNFAVLYPSRTMPSTLACLGTRSRPKYTTRLAKKLLDICKQSSSRSVRKSAQSDPRLTLYIDTYMRPYASWWQFSFHVTMNGCPDWSGATLLCLKAHFTWSVKHMTLKRIIELKRGHLIPNSSQEKLRMYFGPSLIYYRWYWRMQTHTNIYVHVEWYLPYMYLFVL